MTHLIVIAAAVAWVGYDICLTFAEEVCLLLPRVLPESQLTERKPH